MGIRLVKQKFNYSSSVTVSFASFFSHIMSIPTETKVWLLNEQPTDKITSNTFKLSTKPLKSEADLKDGELIVKVLALSNDPAQRGWMDGSIDPVRPLS
jgi:NADPH-dependent curcumin reductase CurA